MQKIKKRRYVVALVLLLSVVFICPAAAARQAGPRLTDQANLLTDSEKTQLLELLDEISERQQTDIVVVTSKSLQGKSAMEYADDFYDENGYGFGEEKDGILFLISMEESSWYVSTSGFGITAVTDIGLRFMAQQLSDDLSKGEYEEAFTIYASLCDDYLTQARMGKPYDADHLPKKPFAFLKYFLTAFGIGFVISLLAVERMRDKLGSVYRRLVADCYVKEDSMKLTKMKDIFLYRQIDRREKQQDNNRPDNANYGGHSGGSSTHESSSGATHGGGGGNF